MSCELCMTSNENVLWQSLHCRVVLVKDADYPGFCRVIWNQHIKEMTDLPIEMRKAFMDTVFAVESAIREVMQPEKINLASLGNVTPHLHWHIIPRYLDDKHFPNPIWAQPMSNTRVAKLPDMNLLLATAIKQKLTS